MENLPHLRNLLEIRPRVKETNKVDEKGDDEDGDDEDDGEDDKDSGGDDEDDDGAPPPSLTQINPSSFYLCRSAWRKLIG